MDISNVSMKLKGVCHQCLVQSSMEKSSKMTTEGTSGSMSPMFSTELNGEVLQNDRRRDFGKYVT